VTPTRLAPFAVLAVLAACSQSGTAGLTNSADATDERAEFDAPAYEAGPYETGVPVTDSGDSGGDASGAEDASDAGDASDVGTTGESGTGMATSLLVVPTNGHVDFGDTLQLSAVAAFADGSSQDVTTSADWTSSDNTLATVGTTTGQVVGNTSAKVGTVTITATYEGQSAAASVVVGAPALEAITITPNPVNLDGVCDTTVQLEAQGIYDDYSVQNVSQTATWSSSDTTLATVDTTGLVTETMTGTGGTVAVTATVGGVTGTGTVVATYLILTDFVIAPSTLSLAVGQASYLSAFVTTPDGDSCNLAPEVTWQSSAPGVATVSSNGSVTGVASGTATITGTYEGNSGSATVTVQ
jgi:trimeric autotransporter adhesin